SVTQEEKMWVALEEFHGHCGLGVTADRVILSAHAQNRNGNFVHISQGIATAGPCCWCRTHLSTLTEQCLLQATQGTARKQGVCLYGLTQHCPVPMNIIRIHTHLHKTEDIHTQTHM
uniref:Uncharacterized protein n=1 Tax=Lates calcarifer TaxID=8187 RepID=A0A4W6D357_LATCA